MRLRKETCSLHLIFNHVTFYLISRSSRLFLEKNSLNSYLSHPTLYAILIQFYSKTMSIPILLPTMLLTLLTSLSPLVSFLNSSNSPQSALLKKYNVDKEDLSNYRPISHLSFLSKLTERVVKQRLTHLSSNHLLNSFQSADTAHHSTESTLLTVHDHIIKAMAHQQTIAICLLDLSAAFDTIDHSILIHRLSSWFGLNGTVLSWLNSYISSCDFVVNIKETISDPLPLHQGVPLGSVLGPLLFILYTTPVSSFISDSSVKHHLYADDTQLFISFSALNFMLNIAHLKPTINIIST